MDNSTFNGKVFRGEEVAGFVSNYKNWYTSKTIWLAILQSLAAVLMIWERVYPTLGWLLISKSAVDIALRFITNEKIK